MVEKLPHSDWHLRVHIIYSAGLVVHLIQKTNISFCKEGVDIQRHTSIIHSLACYSKSKLIIKFNSGIFSVMFSPRVMGSGFTLDSAISGKSGHRTSYSSPSVEDEARNVFERV